MGRLASALICFLFLVATGIVCGYCIHLQLGSEALNAWGTYLTGTATIVLSCAAIMTGFLAVREYGARTNAEKARWLYQLYEKFFENNSYKHVRRKLDYDHVEEIEGLIQMVGQNKSLSSDQEAHFDEFTDYLNFFEMIGLLKKLGQLTSADIRATFDYYLRLLTNKRNPQIRQYLVREGFENLDRLLVEYEKEAPDAAVKEKS